jgi:hypothetical protein
MPLKCSYLRPARGMQYITTHDQHEILQDKNMILKMKHKIIRTCLQQKLPSNKRNYGNLHDAVQ